jgi:hypothetical protein
MNIPSLPIDSIYKFSAFSGLFIILFVLYIFNGITESFLDKLLKVKLDLKRGEVYLEYVEARREEIHQINKFRKEGPATSDERNKSKKSVDTIFVELTQDDYKTMVREFNKLLLDEKIKVAERSVFIEELAELEGRRRSYITAAFVAMIIGFGLSFWGFVCWHTRVQRYQDQVLKNQAAKLG